MLPISLIATANTGPIKQTEWEEQKGEQWGERENKGPIFPFALFAQINKSAYTDQLPAVDAARTIWRAISGSFLDSFLRNFHFLGIFLEFS